MAHIERRTPTSGPSPAGERAPVCGGSGLVGSRPIGAGRQGSGEGVSEVSTGLGTPQDAPRQDAAAAPRQDGAPAPRPLVEVVDAPIVNYAMAHGGIAFLHRIVVTVPAAAPDVDDLVVAAEVVDAQGDVLTRPWQHHV